MKRLVSLFLIFSLVSTQLLAYNPAGLQGSIDQSIQIFDSNEISVEKLKTEKVSREKFEESKAKIIKTYSSEYKKVSKKSEKKQNKRAFRKLKNRFALLRRKIKNMSEKQFTKIANMKKSSPEEIKQSLTSSFSKENEIRTKEQLALKIADHGSYANFLKASIDEVTALTYEEVAKVSNNKDAKRVPASMYWDDLAFVLIFFFIIIPVALITLFVIGLILLITGAGGIVIGILTGAVAVGAVIYIIALSDFTLW